MHKLLHYISCKTEAKQHKPGPNGSSQDAKKILGDLVLKTVTPLSGTNGSAHPGGAFAPRVVTPLLRG